MRTLLACLVAAALLVACNSDTDTPQADGRGGGRGAGGDPAPACDPGWDAAFRAWAEVGFSGSVAVTTGGEPDCLAGYGEADRDTGRPNAPGTVFGIGSVSKAFAAAAIFHLLDEGELALDDRAGDLVPDLTGPAADATVEQLLHHTSGLTGSHGTDHEPLDRDAAVAAISRLEQAVPPGSEFLYSNAGYTLLALIVEEASGTPYRDFMASEILRLPDGGTAGGFWDGEPAAPGPRAVGYLDDGPTDQMGDFPGPHWALHGNGDLAMTVPQLAAWTRALFTGEILSPASTEAVATPGFNNGDGTTEAPGWVVFDAELFGEPGHATAGGGGETGHNAVVVWLPESDRVIAMASNGPEVTAEDLLQAVGPALVAGDPLPRPEGGGGDGDVDPAELAALEGTYELTGGGAFEVTAAEGGVEVAATGAAAVVALFPPPDGVTAADVAAHEQDVLALLRGETQEGRDERALIEEELGPIDGVELGGTVVDGSELHSYVTIRSGSESLLFWYALDEAGGIGAVEGPTDPPTLRMVPSGDAADGSGGSDGSGGETELRPDDPTGRGPDVTVAFSTSEDGEGRMTVAGPAGTTDARLAG